MRYASSSRLGRPLRHARQVRVVVVVVGEAGTPQRAIGRRRRRSNAAISRAGPARAARASGATSPISRSNSSPGGSPPEVEM